MSTAIPWYPILFGVGLALTATVSYFSSQISLASELGDRPTREEMNGHIEKLEETIVREVTEVKEQQKANYEDVKEQQSETRQDIRDLRQLILDGRR